MSFVDSFPTIAITTAPEDDPAGIVARLAVASLRNGSMPEGERAQILEAAQRAGVTTWEYLRGRLLIQARIALTDWAEERE